MESKFDLLGITYIASSLKRNLLIITFIINSVLILALCCCVRVRWYGERILKTIGIQFYNTGVLVMTREQEAYSQTMKHMMETTLQIESVIRKEIDYANAIDELETTIQYTIEQSLLRRDGESIQYVLERVLNKYLHLVMPDINFNDVETDD